MHTQIPLFNGIEIVSVLQRIHGEIGRPNSDVQQRDEQTNRQTDRQKTQHFCPPWRRLKSLPNSAWQQRTSSTFLRLYNFWGSDVVSPLGGAETLGVIDTLNLNPQNSVTH